MPIVRRRRTVRACVAQLLTLVALAAVGACSKPTHDLQAGSYRATLELPGHQQVPFGLDVAREESGWVFYLINGPERVRVSEVQAGPGRVTARMPGYEHRLSATIEGGRLAGTFEFVRGAGPSLKLPFAAELGATWRFDAEPLSDNADFAGLWDLTLTDAQGRRTRAIGDLGQRFEQVTGTVLLPTHDQRFLAGEARDDTLRLSRFDGGALLLYEGKLDTHGQWVGDTWSDSGAHATFVARRNPDATLERIVTATPVSLAEDTLRFSLPDVDGRILTHDAPEFAGRVLLIGVGRSDWPGTHDLARDLATVGERYRERGLAVAAVLREPGPAFERSATAVRRFRAANAVRYPTLITTGSTSAPAMRGVPPVPAVMIVDRAGRVRQVVTQVLGPAAGERHAQQWLGIGETVEALLAETTEADSPGFEPTPAGSVSPGSS